MSQKTKNKKQKKSGYTLIELLAVMIILIAVGTIIAAILVSALRGGNRSVNTNDVRQNGSYAISQMSKMIAYAQSFVAISQTGDFVNPANYRTDCLPSPSPQYHYLKIESFDGNQTTFICDIGNANPIASQSASAPPTDLINTGTTAVTSCYFTCEQSSVGIPPTIDINFDLSPKPTTPGITPVIEKQTQINFQTSVTLRNNL